MLADAAEIAASMENAFRSVRLPWLEVFDLDATRLIVLSGENEGI